MDAYNGDRSHTSINIVRGITEGIQIVFLNSGSRSSCECRGRPYRRWPRVEHSTALFFIYSISFVKRSRGSVVGIATGYGLDDIVVGFQSPVGSRILSSPRRPYRLWGPPSLLSNGYQGLFLRGGGREADHSLPTSAEVKKMWLYTSTSPYAFMA
jgi:hypothetical protein